MDTFPPMMTRTKADSSPTGHRRIRRLLPLLLLTLFLAVTAAAQTGNAATGQAPDVQATNGQAANGQAAHDQTLGQPSLDGLTLTAPDTVDEGTAFVVRIVSPVPMTAANIKWLGKTIPLQMDGDRTSASALLGIGMTEKIKGDTFPLIVDVGAGSEFRRIERSITRKRHDYPEQHLKVARKYTSLSQEALDRYQREKKLIVAAKDTMTPEPRWTLPLTTPVHGRISSAFGLRRFFNGEARSPHSGLDIAAPSGTPIKACASGRVVLSDDHYFSGKSVYIDHGQGVVSMYFHLSEIDVKNGQLVRAGEVVGKVGKTGRVTGPHLHFGLSTQGQLVDPTPLLQSME